MPANAIGTLGRVQGSLDSTPGYRWALAPAVLLCRLTHVQ